MTYNDLIKRIETKRGLVKASKTMVQLWTKDNDMIATGQLDEISAILSYHFTQAKILNYEYIKSNEIDLLSINIDITISK